jgi:hypothetical protein
VPMLVYGNVTVGGSTASGGITVRVSVPGAGGIKTSHTFAVPPGVDGSGFSYSLKIPGDDTEAVGKTGAVEGDQLLFDLSRAGGQAAQAVVDPPSGAFFVAGSIVRLDLAVASVPAPPSGGGFGAPPNEEPTANAGGPYVGFEGDSITFDGSLSVDPDNALTFQWDFGDGKTGTDVSPTNLYEDDGEFTVVLTVTEVTESEDPGLTATSEAIVNIANVAPTVQAGSDLLVNQGTIVEMTPAIYTDPGTVDTHTSTIAWGDGTVESGSVNQEARTISGSHVYSLSGTFIVTVMVSDDDGASDSDSFTVTVVERADELPVAVASVDRAMEKEGTSFFFDASGSTDDLGITKYLWDFGDGTSGSGIFVPHIYQDNGSFLVELMVVDTMNNRDTDTVTVTVANVAPSVEMRLASKEAKEGDAISVVVLFTDPGADEHSVEIRWGDGDILLVASAVSPAVSPVKAVHVYTDEGAYNVTAVVTDDDGISDSVTDSVVISNVSPQVNAGVDQAGFLGENMTILTTFSDPGTADTHVATIEWGDGFSSNGVVDGEAGTVKGSHIYDVSGTFETTVTVSDDDGGVGSDGLVNTVMIPAETSIGLVVLEVDVVPEETSLGIPVTASITAKNVGETIIPDATVDVLVNNTLQDTLSFGSMVPAQVSTIEFPIRMDEAGTYVVQAGMLFDIFAIPDADIQVESFEVSPRVLEVGGQIDVFVGITNLGGVYGSRSLTLALDGESIKGFNPELGPKESVVLSYSFDVQKGGIFPLELLGPEVLFSENISAVAPQLEVAVTTDHNISPLARAFDKSGKKVEFVPGEQLLLQKANSVRLVVPVVLDDGEELDSFVDPVSNISITGTNFSIPVVDPKTGKTTIRLTGTLETPLTGAGGRASAIAKVVVMGSDQRSQDLTADDPRVGLVTATMDVDLVSIPPDSTLSMLIKRDPSAEEKVGLEELARRLAHPVTGDHLTIGEIGATVQIDTSLSNENDVDNVTFYVAFGEEWLDLFLQDPNAIPIMGHISGEGENRTFNFLGAECFAPDEVLPEGFPDMEQAGRFVCQVISPTGFSVFSLLTLVPLPATMNVTDVIVSPDIVEPGEPVVIAAQVSNTGENRGSFTAILKVDGQSAGVRDITLEAGATGTVRFFVIREKLATYEVEIEGIFGSFQVAETIDPANLRVLALTVDPEVVEPGNTVAITATVFNTGGSDGSTNVELMLNGVLNQTKMVTVPAGGDASVSFQYVPPSEGTYDVQVADKVTQLTVRTIPLPPRFELSGLQISPQEVAPGQEVSIQAILANVGGLQSSFVVRLLVDGDEVDSQTITLGGASSIPAIFLVTRAEPATYQVKIGDMTSTFRVVVVATPTPVPTPTPTPAPVATPTPTPTAVPTPTPTPTATPTTAPTPTPSPATPSPTPIVVPEEEGGGFPILFILIGAVVVIVGGGVGGYLFVRNKSNGGPRAPSDAGPPAPVSSQPEAPASPAPSVEEPTHDGDNEPPRPST